MGNVLYLVHRMPYPPDKGDKVRSYHLLKHLQQRHRVFLGTFIDDPQDEAHLPALRALCPDLHVERLSPMWGKVRSLTAMLSDEALSVRFYRSQRMHDWVASVVRDHHPEAAVVFSGAMAQFATPHVAQVPMLLDLVDVDSVKWAQYAQARRGLMAWLYQRESRCLLAFEREAVAHSEHAFLVTDKEASLFHSLAPESQHKVKALCNGVDASVFSPEPDRPSPFASPEQPIVFTGAMDYWPNVDGVIWFVKEVLPLVRQRWPQATFHVVGRNPTPDVCALQGPGVNVTGTVPDVRPYLQHAHAVVAPLRVARGIQNKILEAMAMAQPVITVPGCAQAISATSEQGVWVADSPQEWTVSIDRVLSSPKVRAEAGLNARRFVIEHFSWEAHLSGLDACWPHGAVR
jgi:polysaccharide biosynthesis protein PslH